MKTIIVDGREIQVSVQPSRARKTVEIEYRSSKELVVKIPQSQEVDLEALLKKHRGLIEKKYRDYLSKIKILDKDTVLYKGIPHHLEIKYSVDPQDDRITVEDDIIIIRVTEKRNPTIVLKKWMTEETKVLINETSGKYSDQIRETPTRVSVTDTQRWGYARKNGAIVFNWQLIALPPKIAEFVILHEFIHLSHLNHQRGFHSKMVSVIPDYKLREKELKRYIAIEPNFEYKGLICYEDSSATRGHWKNIRGHSS